MSPSQRKVAAVILAPVILVLMVIAGLLMILARVTLASSRR